MRGEPFYGGWPASYWRGVVGRWNHEEEAGHWTTVWRDQLWDTVGVDSRPAVLRGEPGSVAVLLELLRDEDDGVQSQALHALEYLDPVTAEDVPYLITALRHENPGVRYWAAYLLARAAADAKPSADALTAALKDGDADVRAAAAAALGQMDPPGAVP